MVDDKKERERQQECLRMFRHYFPEMDRGQGVLSKIKGDLEKIKKINDLEEKYQEASFVWTKHTINEAHAASYYSAGKLSELGISFTDTVEKYRKLLKKLWDLQIEAIKQQEKQKETAKSEKVTKSKLKTNQTQSKTAFKNTQSTQNQTSQKEEYISCTECLQEIKPGVKYHYHKTKKDGNKFCSEQCFTEYYGEYCWGCMNKFLIARLYAPNKNNPKYLLCLACWEKEKQEQKELETPSTKDYCETCGVELTGKDGETNIHCAPCWEKEIEKVDHEELEREQNRTEQNRTEQNRTEQNRTEQNRTEQNRTIRIIIKKFCSALPEFSAISTVFHYSLPPFLAKYQTNPTIKKIIPTPPKIQGK